MNEILNFEEWMRKFSYMKFSLLSLAASSAMRLRSLHSWLIASMQADDWIPNNWNGVTAGVSDEGGFLGSDVNSFSDPALGPLRMLPVRAV